MLRISPSINPKYTYALSDKDAHIVRSVGKLGIFLSLSQAVGFYLFASQSAPLAILFTPFFLVILIYNFLESFILSNYYSFSIKDHRRLVASFYTKNHTPKVAVMIPAAGEEVEILHNTLNAALRMRYSNFEVFLLDDSKKAQYQSLVTSIGGRYFRRKNVGYHKKAGNLNALIEAIRSENFEYILVLDADFAPRREMLHELVPYTADEVAIVQSPQHFNLSKEILKRSKFEYGAALIQRDFYRITQSARNHLGGAICVGTNALYSVEALRKVGGFEGVGVKAWGHSEDVNTGLKMINTTSPTGKTYRIEYVPIQLAQGACPDTHISFYKQQNRWATGSMQLIFSKKTLFSKRLSFSQKLCYLTNSSYYFYTMALLFSPLQLLALLLNEGSFDWQSTLLFLPSLILSLILTPYMLRRSISIRAGSLVVLSNAYTFVQALFLLIIRRPLGWEATGTTSVSQKNNHFMFFKYFCVTFFICVYLIVFITLILNFKLTLTPSLIISALFLGAFVVHVIYLHYMFMSELGQKRPHRDPHGYGYAILAGLLILSSGTAISLRPDYDLTFSAKTILALEHETSTNKTGDRL